MSKTMQMFRPAVLAAALATAFGSALAQDADLKAFTKPDSSISAGLGYWTNDRPQQGIYDGMNKSGLYGLLDANIARREETTGTWFSLYARNLAIDNRELRVDWLRQGNIGAYLEYSRITRDNPYTFFTATQGLGTSTIRVPTCPGLPGCPAVANPPLGEQHFGTVRDLVQAGFYKNFLPGLDFRASFRNEDKNGTRNWGRGGAAEFAVEPYNSTTQIAEATLDYLGKNFQVSGGYIGSWFKNQFNLIDTALTTGANQYFLSQPHDNEAHQFFANGGYNFTPGTRGTLKLSYTRATQNEQNPSSSLTGAFAPLAGSPSKLDGRLETTLVQAGVTSRLSSMFSLLANLRYYNNEEKTPQARYVQTGAGTCATTQNCVDNTPLGFKTMSGKVEGTARLPQGFSLIGAVEYADQDRIVPVGAGSIDANGVDRQRYVPFKAKLEETTYKLQARRSLSETINGSLAYTYSDRSGSQYTLAGPGGGSAESNAINPIHIADRERQKWRMVLDWMPIEPLNFTLNLEDAKDKYGHDWSRPYGLQDGTASLYSLDATFSFNEAWNVTAWYAYDVANATQISQRDVSGTAPDAVKDARLEDRGKTIGVGLRGRVNPRFKLGADLLYSETRSRYPETIQLTAAGTLYPANMVGPLKDIENKLTRLKLFMDYEVQKNSNVRFDYIHERWTSDEWMWQFANGTTFTYGTTTDGTQVTFNPKQKSDYFGVRYIYKFQ